MRAQDTAEAVVASLTERRASVAGVSMDEEMANMMRFQRGYQAAARAMTTMDDALDTLINRMGRVGL
jgi:flagellar hook-associated protein 1 FlgK